MTCKDCVHYERCKWNADTLRDVGLLVDFTDDDESASKRCIFFKNKGYCASCIFVCFYGYSATVESIRLFPDGDIVFCGGNKGKEDYIPFHSKEIGEYVFLTKEDAEQKLKGGADNGKQ